MLRTSYVVKLLWLEAIAAVKEGAAKSIPNYFRRCPFYTTFSIFQSDEDAKQQARQLARQLAVQQQADDRQLAWKMPNCNPSRTPKSEEDKRKGEMTG